MPVLCTIVSCMQGLNTGGVVSGGQSPRVMILAPGLGNTVGGGGERGRGRGREGEMMMITVRLAIMYSPEARCFVVDLMHTHLYTNSCEGSYICSSITVISQSRYAVCLLCL